MSIVSKWKIDLKGFELFRFGSDNNLYKLPYKSANGKTIGVKQIVKDRRRWQIIRNGKREKWSENQLKPFIVIDDNPITLFSEYTYPY